ncbi:lycopene cyclase [Intrasporangium oryzae NRRL B-24470]|uniref:Lycopene cyclase n=1 Tax=Intrasporangium oryzae NRRL B-24470 TaxID=1386089 RepID=W9G909_9MICO|nr:lycopene cyclase domain-containing protein [Intrasporangium oryzae]EWT02500.1 lycopene cyclase [Intrasporangium oryzae NRRL B-24470]
MREYTVLAVLSVVVTLLLDRRLGVHVFRRAQYWIALAIVFAFQVLVDGWLTKLSAPIVIYSPEHFLGVRFPWDIPVEDYLFGFSMVTSTIVLWEWGKRTRGETTPVDRQVDGQSDRQVDRQSDRQSDRQPDRHFDTERGSSA